MRWEFGSALESVLERPSCQDNYSSSVPPLPSLTRLATSARSTPSLQGIPFFSHLLISVRRTNEGSRTARSTGRALVERNEEAGDMFFRDITYGWIDFFVWGTYGIHYLLRNMNTAHARLHTGLGFCHGVTGWIVSWDVGHMMDPQVGGVPLRMGLRKFTLVSCAPPFWANVRKCHTYGQICYRLIYGLV